MRIVSPLMVCLIWLVISLTMTPVVLAKDSTEAMNLLKTAQDLEGKTSAFTEIAEKRCYWIPKAPKTQECMQQEVEKMNAKYGAGAFVFNPQLNIVHYSGVHYEQLLRDYPGTDAASEADYHLLNKQLIGHPDVVLPRVKDFLARHRDGKWQAAGLLLWARLNEDIWYIHRKWSWVLYNGTVSPEELIVKSEPYRQEALKTFERLTKEFKKFPEAKIAEKEHALLKDYKTDGKLYGIVNETGLGSVEEKP